LVSILNDWSESPESDLPTEAQLDVQSLAQLADDVQLTAVQQVADSLAVQLARLRAKRVVDDIKTSLSGAQEMSRLLQHFAVGSVREPQANVLAALKGK
jgi:predicted peroxiredoxin